MRHMTYARQAKYLNLIGPSQMILSTKVPRQPFLCVGGEGWAWDKNNACFAYHGECTYQCSKFKHVCILCENDQQSAGWKAHMEGGKG